MLRKIAILLTTLLVALTVISTVGAASETTLVFPVQTRTGYIEQIDRTGPVILYRLVETNRAYSNKETTLGYIRARGSADLKTKVDGYTLSGFRLYPYKFNWSYADYTGKKIPYVLH